LLEKAECKTWLYAEDDKDGPPNTLPAGIKRIALPSLEWCLDANGHKRYPYDKTWHEAKHDVVLFVHTSGTTGMPKPIYITNGYLSAGNEHVLSKKHWPRGISFDAFMCKTMLSTCPPQWLGGIYAYMVTPVFCHTSPVILPHGVSCTPAVFKKLMTLNLIDGLFSPPHTIIQLYNDTEAQSLLKSLSYVMYIGAAMDRNIGNDLAQYTRMTTAIGSTENGPQHNINPVDKMLWDTLNFGTDSGGRMERIEGSGLSADGSDDYYELILERQHDSPNLWQRAFWNPIYKGVNRIETKELYSPVKDIDGQTRWRFHARKDDLTKLSWLAKFHAQDIEKRILQHPSVSSVFVGGEGRPTPYVIVEPKAGVVNGESTDALLDGVYASVVADANKNDIEEINIPKETVFLTHPDKPFKRTGKQTLMRKEIEKDYREEIERAYERLAKAGA
jgi:acyl-coenzyme A synthetase/AMP-(fatty) acid ligase